MVRSTFTLVALLAFGPAFVGCSGFQPFWQSDSARAAADRSIEGPLTLARLAEQRGKNLEAERLYRSLLEKHPDHAAVHHRLAVIQSRKGRFEEANTHFDRALQLKPDDPRLICDAGYCLYLQHRLDQAESLLRHALDVDPQHEASMNNLALVLAEKGDDRAAFALFRETGTEARAHANMGFVYTRRGELDKAKEAYSRALSVDPQMFVAAEALVQLTHFERQARTAATQARGHDAGRSGRVPEVEAHHRLVNHEFDSEVAGPKEPAQPGHIARLPDVTPPRSPTAENEVSPPVASEPVPQPSGQREPASQGPVKAEPLIEQAVPPGNAATQHDQPEAASSRFVAPEPAPSVGWSWASSP